MASAPEQSAEASFRWKFAGAEFDETRWELIVRGAAQDLERKPLVVLSLLLRHAGEVVTKEELFEAAWPGVIVVEGALTNAISKLRRALGDDAQAVIATVPKAGYRLVGKVERKAIAPASPAARSLKAGEPVMRRENWRLAERLDASESSEVWRAEHVKTREPRIFKFSLDGSRLSALKREATLSRVLFDALGSRPDIARVVDWNFEDAPYFLECEYGGVDLERWGLAGNLASTPHAERLRLFLETAEAVAAAHSVGVLHKDLKPANVLVRQDDDGLLHSRLTDFGSGRLLEPGQLEKLGITRLGTTQTQSESLTGTPLYLAPELISGQSPTVQSDIYALGVMLYQLLAGDLRKPMAPGWEANITDDLLREDISAAAHGNPGQRLTSVAELAQRLHTLDERRARRDAERAEAQRADIAERALARARARRPWLVATGAALLAGLAVSGYYYREAAAARDAAERKAELAEAVENFLKTDFIKPADPEASGRTDTTVLEAVQQAAGAIDRRFEGNRELAGRLHDAVGRMYAHLARYPDAAREYRKAIDLLGTSASAEQLASLYDGLVGALIHDSKVDDATTVLGQMKGRLEVSAKYPAVGWRIAEAEGTVASFGTDMPKALAAFSRAYDLAQRAGVPLTDLRQNLLDRYSAAGEFAEAVRVGEPLESELAAAHGVDHPLTLGASQSLGFADIFLGRYDEAIRRLQHVYERHKAVYGAESETTLDTLDYLVLAYLQHRQFAEAYRAETEVYTTYRRKLGADHLRTRYAADNYGQTLAGVGKFEEAAAVDEAELARPPIPTRPEVRFNYAGVLVHLRKYAEALKQLDGVTPEGLKVNTPLPDYIGRIALIRAQALHGLGQDAEALTQARVAIEDLTAHPAPDTPLPDGRKFLHSLEIR